MPLVLRMVSGGGVRLGAQHSQSLEALFAHIPGLVVAMPSNPYDAKGLLAAAIQDDNPVIFLEQKLLFFDEPAPVPEERYAIELGKARIARAGRRRDRGRARRAGAAGAAGGARARGGGHRASRCSTRGRSSRSTRRRSRRRSRRRTASSSCTRRSQFCGFGAEIAAYVARALLLGPRRAGRPRRRAVASDPVPEGSRAARRCPARRTSPPPCARSPSSGRSAARPSQDAPLEAGSACGRASRSAPPAPAHRPRLSRWTAWSWPITSVMSIVRTIGPAVGAAADQPPGHR